jgi:hypothetical protein
MAQAVDQMVYLQLDKKLSDEDFNNILRFLTTLADEKLTTTAPMTVNASTRPTSNTVAARTRYKGLRSVSMAASSAA